MPTSCWADLNQSTSIRDGEISCWVWGRAGELALIKTRAVQKKGMIQEEGVPGKRLGALVAFFQEGERFWWWPEPPSSHLINRDSIYSPKAYTHTHIQTHRHTHTHQQAHTDAITYIHMLKNTIFMLQRKFATLLNSLFSCRPLNNSTSH